jgi:hypothetical protein
MTAGFTTERQDPDLQHVSDALLRAGQRAREIARQSGTGIAVEIDGELRILQGAELDMAMERSDAGEALDMDADGLPLFRPDPAVARLVERCGLDQEIQP